MNNEVEPITKAEALNGRPPTVTVYQFPLGGIRAQYELSDIEANGRDFVRFVSGSLKDDGLTVGFILDDKIGRCFKCAFVD